MRGLARPAQCSAPTAPGMPAGSVAWRRAGSLPGHRDIDAGESSARPAGSARLTGHGSGSRSRLTQHKAAARIPCAATPRGSAAMTAPFTPKMISPDEGKTVKLFGVRFHYKIESTDSGGSLAVLEVEIPPRTLVKPHAHSREDEFSFVISGTVGARIGDRVLDAGPGAYLAKPRGIPHAMWNATSDPARVAEILSPQGWKPTSRNWRRS